MQGLHETILKNTCHVAGGHNVVLEIQVSKAFTNVISFHASCHGNELDISGVQQALSCKLWLSHLEIKHCCFSMSDMEQDATVSLVPRPRLANLRWPGGAILLLRNSSGRALLLRQYGGDFEWQGHHHVGGSVLTYTKWYKD